MCGQKFVNMEQSRQGAKQYEADEFQMASLSTNHPHIKDLEARLKAQTHFRHLDSQPTAKQDQYAMVTSHTRHDLQAWNNGSIRIIKCSHRA